MIKLLSKNVQLSFFPNMSMKTLVVNNFVFIIGFKTILTALCQGWCWNTTSPKEGDKDLCRTHKDAKTLVLLPSMFLEIIPNKIVDLIALYMYILTSVCIFSILFSLHSLRGWQGEFVYLSKTSLVDDYFLELGVILWGEISFWSLLGSRN